MSDAHDVLANDVGGLTGRSSPRRIVFVEEERRLNLLGPLPPKVPHVALWQELERTGRRGEGSVGQLCWRCWGEAGTCLVITGGLQLRI